VMHVLFDQFNARGQSMLTQMLRLIDALG
jgi:hypothetical protein